MRNAFYRPHPKPSVLLPLNVRSTGHYRLEKGAEERREAGRFEQLFWCVDGSGTAETPSGRIPLGAGTVFFFYEGEPQSLQAGPDGLEYRWLTLDGPASRSTLQAFGLERVQESPPCPASLFRRLERWVREAMAGGERTTSQIAYEILLTASRVSPARGGGIAHESAVRAAKELFQNRFTDARLDVTQVAASLKIHRSTLYRGFRKLYGVSPVQYLSRLRINHALQLLKETALPAADIAVRSGISDVCYLSRLLRQTTGAGPRELRKKMRS
ncbi:MAG: AraC family transcriptional regulator [Chthoniobacteraceae bacterium]|nr:AraC family transcriptional regulator [Chthoniobacteraceae bacterium]